MIQINSRKGELNCRGPMDDILCEYTLLTRVILRELKSEFGEETANTILAGLGKIAVKDIDEVHQVSNLFKEVDEVLNDEV